MNRARLDDDNSGGKYLRDSNKDSNKDKPLKARVSKPNTTSKDGDKPTRIREKGKKRRAETNNNDIKTSDIY